jgi:hypothetical protein
MRTLARLWAGRLLGALRIPGVMVSQTYDAQITHATVRVYLGPLFSVVSVNGLDIYFHRLTGKIDGVGFSAPTDCRSDEVR